MPLPTNDDEKQKRGGIPTALPDLEQAPPRLPAVDVRSSRLPIPREDTPRRRPPERAPLPDQIPQEEEVFDAAPPSRETTPDQSSPMETDLEDLPEESIPVDPQPIIPPPVAKEIIAPEPEAQAMDTDPVPTDVSDSEKKSNFIDRKNKKLLPFGGIKSKASKKAKQGKGKNKSARFDSRPDKRVQARIIQSVALLIITVIAAVGFYNALHPAKGISRTQVDSLLEANITPTYGYPTQRAEAFATNFLNSYLVFSGNRIQGNTVSSNNLGYYYTGTLGADNGSQSNLTLPANAEVKQTIITPAQIFSSDIINSSSAQFSVGAEVMNKKDGGKSWVYYNIGVYYNASNKLVYLTPNSPTPIPSLGVGDATSVPTPVSLASGQTSPQLDSSVQSVVNGFMRQWTQTSSISNTAIQPFITSNPDNSVYNGLGGMYSIAIDNIGGNGIVIVAAPITATNSSIVIANVTVNLNRGSGNSAVQYKGSYSLVLEKQSNGKYLVDKIIPTYYQAG
jgi:hypothetical protein